MEQSAQHIISFNRLYQDYQERFVRFAQSYVRDLAVAEDITMEALVYYWENRLNMEEDVNVPAYILTSIKNKCLNYLRHLQIKEDYSANVQEYYQWELKSRIHTLEACEPVELFTEEIQRLVDEALENMPEKTRKVFILSRYENKSYKEIAELMGISTKGVDFHMGKALKLLRIHLKDYFPLFLYFFYKSH